MLTMLLIIVLQELTEIPKRFVARTTLVRILGRTAMVIVTIGKKRRARQVGSHGRLRLGKLVNVFSGIVLPETATAVPAFHMLHRIGTGTKPRVATDRTGHVARTMDLHVHLQRVPARKLAIAFAALKSAMDLHVHLQRVRAGKLAVAFAALKSAALAALDTVSAARRAFALAPLITAKVVAFAPILTVRTVPTHLVVVKKGPRRMVVVLVF
jgi:hypothetical protein